MSTRVVYEIAHYKDQQVDPVLLEQLQLLAEDGDLRLRDVGGNEIPCAGADIVSVIRSNPALWKVPKGHLARITCGDDVMGQLPALLEPIPDGTSLFVNGKAWDAFPTLELDERGLLPGVIDGFRPPRRPTDMMLPGHCDYTCKPEMNPCWAEYRCAEGGHNFEDQLVGHSSIGFLAPGIAIEHGRTDYGGNGGAAAVTTITFDDFATTFIDWLLNTPILSSLWQGDGYITTPDADLFAKAAAAADHVGYWEEDGTAEDEDDRDDVEEDDTDDEDDHWDEGSFASRRLELHLSQELIEQVRARLSGH